MENTIGLLRKVGVFDLIIQSVKEHALSKEDVANLIDDVCLNDENFANTFFRDIHDIGINLLWNELQYAVDRLPKKEVKNDEIINLLKQILDKLI